MADDGTVTGLSEKLEGLKKAEATSFLFAEEQPSGKLAGAKATETGTGNGAPASKKPEEMTYEDFVKAEESAGQ